MPTSRSRFLLRQYPDFFTTAHKQRGSFFAIFFQPSDVNVGGVCVATKKNFPTAVARNRVKRQVRALLSPLFRTQNARLQIVVIVYQPIQTRHQREELQTLLQTLV
jgi:ribonuclease P protein component